MALEKTLTILAGLLLLSLILERAFHFIFHFSLWRKFFEREDSWIKSLKALIVFGVSLWVCIIYDIDAIAWIIAQGNEDFLGISITALVISGGSSGIRRIMIFIRTLSDEKIRITKGE